MRLSWRLAIVCAGVTSACTSSGGAASSTDLDGGSDASSDGGPSADDGGWTSDGSPVDAPGDASDGGDDLGPPGPSYAWNGSYDLPDGVCSTGGWCVEEKGPYPTAFAHVWSPTWSTPSAGDLWMTGATTGNAVLRFQNNTWRGLIGLPTSTELGPISGTGPNDVWIGKLRWNGTKLQINAKAPPGSAPWFLSSTDGWSVGTSAWHWDGTDWTAFATGTVKTLTAVHGFASNDVWALANQELRHWDGTAWNAAPVALPAGAGLSTAKLGGSSSTNLWVVDAGAAYRFNGSSWSTITSPFPGTAPLGISSGATTSVMFPSNRYTWNGAALVADGVTPCASALQGGCGDCVGAWLSTNDVVLSTGVLGNTPQGCPATQRSGGAVTRLGGYGPGQLWAWLFETATSKFGVRFDGTFTHGGWSLTVVDKAKTVSGTSASDVWVAGKSDASGFASHYNGGSWTPYSLDAEAISEVGISSPTAAWVLTRAADGTVGSAFFNGATWTSHPGPPIPSSTLPNGSIWGVSAADAWAVSSGGCHHWNGATWSNETTCGPAVKVWGSAANDVWFFGSTGRVVRWNGSALSVRSPGSVTGFVMTPELPKSISVSSWNDVWAASTAGRVFHWNGYVWEETATGWSGSFPMTISVTAGYGRVSFNDGTVFVRKP